MKRHLFYFLIFLSLVAYIPSVAASDKPADIAEVLRRLDEQSQRISKLESENQALREAVARLQADQSIVVSNILTSENTQIPSASANMSTPPEKLAGILKPLTERGVQLKPYGYIKVDLIHNTEKTDGDDYSFYVRPPWESGAGGQETTIGLRESRFGLDMIVPERENGIQLSGKFEIDFYKGTVNNPDLRVRHAYLNAEMENGWSVLAGQTLDACWVSGPKMLDGAWAGGTGHPYSRRPQLRLTKTHTTENNTRLTARVAAAQNAGADFDDNKADDGSASGWPLTQGAVVLEKQLLTKRFSKIGFSGSYGRERIDNAPEPDVDGVYDENLVMVTTVLPLSQMITLSGALFEGKNMDTYKGGILQGINMTRGVAIASRGGWVQSTLDPVKNWQFHLGYGCEDAEDDDLETTDRSFNERYYANVFWYLTPHLRVAAEYAHLMTEFHNSGSASDNQFHFATYYFF